MTPAPTVYASHTVGVQIYRINANIIAVKTLSGDVGLLRSTAATYEVKGPATATWAGSSGAAVASTDVAAIANEVGDIAYFTGVPAGSDITVVAHYIDGTTSTPFSGKIA